MVHSSHTETPPAATHDPTGEPRCIICSSLLPDVAAVRIGTSELRACDACGSWTYLPRPDAADQAAIHDTGDYFDHPYFAPRRNLSQAIIQRCHGVFNRVAQATDVAALRGQRLLDIGCDAGTFLQAAAQEFGIVPVGIDASRRAIEAARERGIEAYQTPVESAPEHLSDFLVITAIDLIEHVAEPADFLRNIRARLRPGGVVYLETPNIRSMVYRIGRGLSHVTKAKFLERLFPPQHVQYFTEASLAMLCQSAGLDIVSIDNRVLPWRDIAARLPVRVALSVLQVLDRWIGTRILICAVLRRPLASA